jgi:hypothetical protein
MGGERCGASIGADEIDPVEIIGQGEALVFKGTEPAYNADRVFAIQRTVWKSI